jgi:hypothetical protein
LRLRRLRCALGGHEYRYEGITLGKTVERCVRCGKVRCGPTSDLASVHRLPARREGDSDDPTRKNY